MKERARGFIYETVFAAAWLLGIMFVLTIGCDDMEMMTRPIIDTVADDGQKPAQGTVVMGEVKEREEEPATPEPTDQTPPADTDPPTVAEVKWYRDWQLTDPITDDVHPGNTIYTTVKFSEPMQHTVAGNNTARPALFIVIDGKATRYRMLPHGVGFQSGEAKPLHDGTDDFICKYTLPADTISTIAFRVGTTTSDTAGNTVVKQTEHPAPFMVTVAPRSNVESVSRPSVRLVYFRPKNYPVRKGAIASLRRLIVDTNRYYADEMQRHGFGRKTFTVETDSSGIPVVHSIVGQFEESHYRADEENWRGVYKAIDEFRERYPDGFQHIYVFVMDMTKDAFVKPTDESSCAVGGLHFADRNRAKDALGGFVALPASGACSENLQTMMHELGHAFGLHHDFRQGMRSNLIMAYGNQSRLSKDSAEWLSVSVFFNDVISHNSPGDITLASDPKRTPQGAQINLHAEDADGLHQIQVSFTEEIGYSVIDFKVLNGLTDTVKFSSPKFTEYKIIVQIIDKKGGIVQRRFPIVD